MLPENCFILTKQQVLNLESPQLYGCGITEDAVIIGSSGYRDYLADGGIEPPSEGRFIGIFHPPGEEIIIRADRTGQDLIYLYQDGEDWAISNSFLLLAETMSQRKNLAVYPPAIIGFHLKHGVHIGEQLVSHRTMVEQIKVVPLTAELVVDKRTGALSERRNTYMQQFELGKDISYEEAFVDFMERCSGILSALDRAALPMNLFLSGGYDSRLVLCLLAVGGLSDRLRVTSHVAKADDFRVAQLLCESLGLPLNDGGPTKRSSLSSGDALRMYLLSCGGTYLPFYPVSNHFLQPNAELRLSGDQPTGWTFFSGSAMFNGDAAKVAANIEQFLKGRPHGSAVRDDFLSTFELLGIELDDPKAMLAYYSAIRSRHHCGRNWYKSLGVELTFTPLTMSRFVSLDLHNAATGHPPTKIFADAFCLFDGWALETPFETPDRAFPQELLDNSPFRGGAEIRPRHYKVYGQIGQDTFGSPDLFSMPLSAGVRPEVIREDMVIMARRANLARKSPFFNQDDHAMIETEIERISPLPHGYRKLSHLIVTDLVLRIVEGS